MSAGVASVPIAVDALWACLDDVPDPELPELSVIDLGVVRELRWQSDADAAAPTLQVVLTTTYSGCPGRARDCRRR